MHQIGGACEVSCLVIRLYNDGTTRLSGSNRSMSMRLRTCNNSSWKGR